MDEIDARRVRAARNQALFREVNERIEELSASSDTSAPAQFVCECLDPGCAEKIPIPSAEYERIRRMPTRFFVAPGHQDPEVEAVVEKTDRYYVVRKIGIAADIAAANDPRSGHADRR
jgi:hypothetical protein